MKFGELVKMHSSELVITRRYEHWMRTNSNPTYSEEALDFCREQLRLQAHPRNRKGTISGSSMGKCPRRQQFVYIGVPQSEPTPKVAGYFVNGTFMHLRWQMAGITEGWLPQAEIPLPANDLGLSGTMDGIAYDGSVVEIKSANSYSFSRVMAFGALEGHDQQLAVYLAATGAEKGILIYECKNTQEYKEIVLEADQLPLFLVQTKVAEMRAAIAAQHLFEPLPEAYENKTPCSGCGFKEVCLKIRSWSDAEELAGEGHS